MKRNKKGEWPDEEQRLSNQSLDFLRSNNYGISWDPTKRQLTQTILINSRSRTSTLTSPGLTPLEADAWIDGFRQARMMDDEMDDE